LGRYLDEFSFRYRDQFGFDVESVVRAELIAKGAEDKRLT